MQAAGIKVAEPKATGNSSSAQAAARIKRDKELEDQNAFHAELLNQVRAKAAALPRSEFDMLLIAKAAWAGVDWEDKRFLADLYGCDDDELEARIDIMAPNELSVFMLNCAL